jgi:formylglycine-generating enzyme
MFSLLYYPFCMKCRKINVLTPFFSMRQEASPLLTEHLQAQRGKAASQVELIEKHIREQTMPFTIESVKPHTFSRSLLPYLLPGSLLILLALIFTGCTRNQVPPGMVFIRGGEFAMGSDLKGAAPDEKPAHIIRVGGFYMDITEVTNRQFRDFVEATSYRTTAEKPPDLNEIMKQLPPDTPPPSKEMLVPGSITFKAPADKSSPVEPGSWFAWTPGADWKHPEGPGSSIEGKDNCPAVHISWFDAMEYAKWTGKRLPTEAEWEYAARGGLEGKEFPWGEEKPSAKKPQAHIWQGRFPFRETVAGGCDGVAPVKSRPPNGYGLYDMAGNVREWCSDWYRADYYKSCAGAGVSDNPTGPPDSLDPDEPNAQKRVNRGGSYLSGGGHDTDYRVSARMRTTPDTSLCDSGFRCVMTEEMWVKNKKSR